MTIEGKKLIFSHVTSVFKVWYKEKPFLGWNLGSWKTWKCKLKLGYLEENKVQRECSGLSPKRIQKVTTHVSLNCKSLTRICSFYFFWTDYKTSIILWLSFVPFLTLAKKSKTKKQVFFLEDKKRDPPNHWFWCLKKTQQKLLIF